MPRVTCAYYPHYTADLGMWSDLELYWRIQFKKKSLNVSNLQMYLRGSPSYFWQLMKLSNLLNELVFQADIGTRKDATKCTIILTCSF